ncbi:MAG: tryptophan synthase subunit alpha [Parvularculaceae bacterium]|nr:tryptophan synthase subunit alpha [Parvularculaceae bacterium]
MGRIANKFTELKRAEKTAFIPFLMAGDPDFARSLHLALELAEAGADLIEIGIAFSDPMADGPAIQASGQRALRGGQTLAKTLDLVGYFRERNNNTPIVLMGYYNPIFIYDVERFAADAVASGVDGVIIVDLPPEEEEEFSGPASKAGLDFIRLVTPTTDTDRLSRIVRRASGFLYYVSIAGITGAAAADIGEVGGAVMRIRQQCQLPVAVGFGIKSASQAAGVAKVADGVVVGSALVELLCPEQQKPVDDRIGDAIAAARNLAAAVHEKREGK